jgi:glycosyltransferase involved in cell wall biosynthesis
MKIILCLHHFLPDFVGGTEIYTLRLAQYLKRAGIEPVVLVPHFDHSTASEYEYEGIRVIRYPELGIDDRKMIMGKNKPGGLALYTEILVKEQPNIIHFHELAPGRGFNIFQVENAHQLNIPIVLSFHVSYYTCIRGSLVYKDKEKCDGKIQIQRCTECIYQSKNITGIKATMLSTAALALYKAGIDATKLNNSIGTMIGFPFVIHKLEQELGKLSKLAQKIVVLSEWYKKVLQINNVPVEKLVFIKQGLSGELHPLDQPAAITTPLKIVYVGRITKLKGLHLLIDAICRLPEHTISLHIYGPETEDGYVAACKQKTVSKNNIHWMGTVPSTDVITVLANYHLLCLPSSFEMSPLVIQEAFAAGLPVLASDVYGNAEQVRDGIDGWLFHFNDSTHLYEKLLYLTNHLDAVESAKANIPPTNSFSEVGEKHIEIYNSIENLKKAT